MFRAPHWSVRIGYLFLKIDEWGSSKTFLMVDSDTKIAYAFYDSNGANICGSNNMIPNEYERSLGINFTHNS